MEAGVERGIRNEAWRAGQVATEWQAMDDASPESASPPPAGRAESTVCEDEEHDPCAKSIRISKNVYRAGTIVVLLLAVVLRLWAIDFGLPHLRTRPDEMPVVDYTMAPARGEADIDWPVFFSTQNEKISPVLP